MHLINSRTVATTIVLLFSNSSAAASEDAIRLMQCQLQLAQVTQTCLATFPQKESLAYSQCVEHNMLTGKVRFAPPFDFGKRDQGNESIWEYRCLTYGDRLMKEFELMLRKEGKFPK